jgi:kynurenine formamidase
MTASTPKSLADALFAECSNAGRWGEDDERGTLNFITSRAVLAAVGAVRTGEVISLARQLTPQLPGHPGAAVTLTVWSGSGHDALDTAAITPHGFEITHLDAVGHSFLNGSAYNGRHAEAIVGPAGLLECDIAAVGGIVTRGVLLDVAAVRGTENADNIGPKDLDQAEALAGARVGAGDAVFVRSASSAPRAASPASDQRAGLLPAAVRWLHQREVAVYSGDCIEKIPSGDASLPMPLHQIGHVAMGLAILDNPDVEVLRRACDRNGRATFFLVIAPLPLRGATGCAVNPLAVF